MNSFVKWGRAFVYAGAGAIALTALGAVTTPADAQDTVKIGLIIPMTGQQASTGKQINAAVKLYMQQKGDTVAGKKIEIILKDDGAVPDNTKRIAQELIVNDKVYITDEDGDVAIFNLSAEQHDPLVEVNMQNSIYTTPVVANETLFIANKTHLFAISAEKEGQ